MSEDIDKIARQLASMLRPPKPFFPTHPNFRKNGANITAKDFEDLARTVDALVEYVAR